MKINYKTKPLSTLWFKYDNHSDRAYRVYKIEKRGEQVLLHYDKRLGYSLKTSPANLSNGKLVQEGLPYIRYIE